jgi:hypothetical protein
MDDISTVLQEKELVDSLEYYCSEVAPAWDCGPSTELGDHFFKPLQALADALVAARTEKSLMETARKIVKKAARKIEQHVRNTFLSSAHLPHAAIFIGFRLLDHTVRLAGKGTGANSGGRRFR